MAEQIVKVQVEMDVYLHGDLVRDPAIIAEALVMALEDEQVSFSIGTRSWYTVEEIAVVNTERISRQGQGKEDNSGESEKGATEGPGPSEPPVGGPSAGSDTWIATPEGSRPMGSPAQPTGEEVAGDDGGGPAPDRGSQQPSEGAEVERPT